MRRWLGCAILALGLAACGGTDGDGGGRDNVGGQDAIPEAVTDVPADTGSADGALDWGSADQLSPDVAEITPDVVEITPDAAPEAEPAPEPGPDVAEPAPDVAPDLPPVDTTPSVTPIGTLTVNCAVPAVLDASKASDMMYMYGHFGDLVQQYGITGTVGGVDITTYPEKMYYGTHPPVGQGSYVSLVQASMTDALAPVYSVRVDFDPDTAVKAGSVWGLGLDAGDAFALLLFHTSLQEYCVKAIGVGGSLTFSAASNVTAVEGGSFSVAGSMDMGDPHDLPGLCDEGVLPCCP